MHTYRGALLDFLENMQNDISRPFEFHSICTYLRGANTICIDPKLLLNIFYKL
jgi:hypothetical protein